MKIRPVGSDFFQADGQTDLHDKDNILVPYRKLTEDPNKIITVRQIKHSLAIADTRDEHARSTWMFTHRVKSL